MTDTTDFPTVSSLVVGGQLTWIEQMCLLSFVRLGHPVVLYHYQEIGAVPPGVELRDARTIWTPPQDLFDQTSDGYIADLFRIHLMHRSDEIWVAPDVVGLAPLIPDQNGFLISWTPDEEDVDTGVLRLPRDSQTLERLSTLATDLTIVPHWLRPALRQRIDAMPLEERAVGRFKASRAVLGPLAWTTLLHETDELSQVQPASVLSPVPWHFVDVLFNPHGGWEGWVTEDTHAVHLWSDSLRHNRKLPPHSDSFVGRIKHHVDLDHAMETGGTEWSPLPQAYAPLAEQAEAQEGLFLETPHHVILYLPSDIPQRLLVSFDDALPEAQTEAHDPAGLTLARSEGWSFLGVLPKRQDWFECDQLAAALDQVRANGLFDVYPKVSFTGHGRGGFASCVFADLCPDSTILTIAPTAPPDGLTDRAMDAAARAARCWILHDPAAPVDKDLTKALEHAGATVLPARHFGPDPRIMLRRIELAEPVLTAALTGRLTLNEFLALIRDRRRASGAYLSRLFATAQERGHLRLGLAAAEKSAKSFDNWKTRKARQSLRDALDAHS